MRCCVCGRRRRLLWGVQHGHLRDAQNGIDRLAFMQGFVEHLSLTHQRVIEPTLRAGIARLEATIESIHPAVHGDQAAHDRWLTLVRGTGAESLERLFTDTLELDTLTMRTMAEKFAGDPPLREELLAGLVARGGIGMLT